MGGSPDQGSRELVLSDNVRAAQCAICALKRKIAHYS